ncbi:DUF4280 domain-containing protein [Sinomicrobium sp.]
MSKNYFVAEKAELKCTLGTAPGKLMVVGDRKSFVREGETDKALANEGEKTLEPPFFGNCKCSSSNPPCSPQLQQWQHTARKSTIAGKKALLDCSMIKCGRGGLITIKNPNQKKRVIGEAFPELDMSLPNFQGEIIFVNGYLSDPIANTESHYNAIMDRNPDEDSFWTMKGENVDEKNRAHDDDIYTAEEHAERQNKKWENIREDEKGPRIKLPTPLLPFSYTPEEKYWGYWNDKSNKKKAVETYANYFNARGNEHFINGSHGLQSNGAHRVDHGIALGYHWAKHNWQIWSRENVEELKEEAPFVESFSPAYTPVTIVGHSQGAAAAAGVALGIMYFAKTEMNWDEIPLNMIYLGVHQPQGLAGDEYKSLLRLKKQHLEVDDFYIKIFGKEAEKGMKYLNSISDLFDEKYNKLLNERGIVEHLKAITGSWVDFKMRGVQFTFANDRGDLVLRDGDIPEMDSACNPDRDTSLYSVEFFTEREQIPDYYQTQQNKQIIDLSEEEEGVSGFIVIPPYIANRRFDFDKVDEENKEELEHCAEWDNYRHVCVKWGLAIAKYKSLKKEYNKVAKEKWYVPEYDRDRNILLKNMEHLKVDWSYLQAARWYAPLQEADLYAHFSPVGLINHKKLLSDFPDDQLGKGSIWDRIIKAGEKKFYRVDYGDDPNVVVEMTEEDKRQKAKSEVAKEKNKRKMISTSIADTPYIKDVIDAYVPYIVKDKEAQKTAEKRLYKEPKYLNDE